MFEGITWRGIALGAIALIIVAMLTVFAEYHFIHKLILDNPNDPLTRQGGLKPEQQIQR
jgi:hypothetical protein